MHLTIPGLVTPRRVLILAAAATLLLALLRPAPATATGQSERADVLTQRSAAEAALSEVGAG